MSTTTGKPTHRATQPNDYVIVNTTAHQFVARITESIPESVHGEPLYRGVMQNTRTNQREEFSDALTGDGLDLRTVLIRPRTIIDTVRYA